MTYQELKREIGKVLKGMSKKRKEFDNFLIILAVGDSQGATSSVDSRELSWIQRKKIIERVASEINPHLEQLELRSVKERISTDLPDCNTPPLS